MVEIMTAISTGHIFLGQTLWKRLNHRNYIGLDFKFLGSFVNTPGPVNKDDSSDPINLGKRQILLKRRAS